MATSKTKPADIAATAPGTQIDPARTVDLSEPWSPASWPYPGHPKSTETIVQYFPKDRANTWLVSTTMHVGTHVDAPLHFASGMPDVASLRFDQLVRPGYMVDLRDVVGDWHVVTPEDVEANLPGPVEPGDALILRYGWQRFGKGHPEENQDVFFNRHPGPGRALVDWMIEKEIAWVGTDAASFEHPANIYLRSMRPDLIGEMEATIGTSETFDDDSWLIAHRKMLERGQLHVDQAGGDLDLVPAERVTLGIFPFRYVGGEAAVSRVVAFI
ncbi:MAG: cyclase family protein [Solirubrobacterales bacterium]